MRKHSLSKSATTFSSGTFLLFLLLGANVGFGQTDHLSVGNGLYTAKDYDGAIRSYTQCISETPKLEGCYFNRGLAYFQKQNWEASIADYTLLVKLNPQNSKAYIRRALAYGKKDNHQQEMADYEAALKIDPTNEPVQRALTAVKNMLASSQKVEVVKQKVVSEQSDIAAALAKTGDQQMARSDFDGALVSYTKCVEAWPLSMECYYNRSRIYGLKKDYDKEIADLTVVSLVRPWPAIFYARGRAYMNKDDLDSAIKDFTKAIEKAPEDPENYFQRSICNYGKKEYTSAINDINQSIKIKPLDAKFYYVRGSIYQASGTNASAIADFKKTLELNPTHARAKDQLIKMGVQP